MATSYNSGHWIFRGQPSWTSFNFNENELLRYNLNDIDPYFLSPEQLNDPAFKRTEILDPRTNAALTRATYDHTQPYKPKLFFNLKKSSLLKSQHVICLRVLQTLQQGRHVNPQDLEVWQSCTSKYNEEIENMHQIIRNYEKNNKHQMYASTIPLNDFYRQWYKRKVELILKNWKSSNNALNNCSGLPQLKACSAQSTPTSEVKLVKIEGIVKKFQYHQKSMHPYTMKYRMAELFEDWIGQLADNSNRIPDPLQYISPQASIAICLPIESLIFLHMASEYVDYPCNMMFEILETKGGRAIVMQEPLPSPNCGRYTNDLIVKGLYKTFTSKMGDTKWLNISKSVVEEMDDEVPEIDGSYCETMPYKPQSFDEFMMKQTGRRAPSKTNEALFSWTLSDAAASHEPLELLVSMEMPGAVNVNATQFTGPTEIRVEYKSQYGCEVLTKYELLKAWYELKLLTESGLSKGTATVLRISADDFRTQLVDQMTRQQIENKLWQYYKIRTPQMLGQLSEFLRMLADVPAGSYMMRNSSKSKNTVLLYTKAQEIKSTTLHMKEVWETEPSDMLFKAGENQTYQPIDYTLCSTVHRYHSILPCTFLPQLGHQKMKPQAKIQKFLSDEEHVAKQMAKKQTTKDADKKRTRKKSKEAIQRKRQRRTESKAEKSRAEKELETEMEIDKILTGA